MSAESEPRRAELILVVVFVLLAAGMTSAGYLSYRAYEHQVRSDVVREVSAVAELKAVELSRWRTRRLADGAFFFGNDLFSGLVDRWFEGTDDPAREQVRGWLGRFQAAHQDTYDRVVLLDTRGVARLSLPATPEAAAWHLSGDASEVLRSGRVSLLDFHRDDPGGAIRLAVLVPILDGAGAARPLGVLVLQVDPEKYLYPFLRRWPGPSSSAETLLVRRDGEAVLFLNDLRFRKGSALTLRRPLIDASLPAARAALGREGVEDGVDYRGVPVVAAVRVVPDSPWSLVARVDVAEFAAPLRERLWMLAALVGATLLASAGGLALVWRQRGFAAARERYRAAEALNDARERFRLAAESSNDVIYEWDLRQRLCWLGDVDRLTGHPPGGFPRTLDGWAEALHPDDRAPVMDAVRAHLADRARYAVEYRVRAGDGSYRWWSARGVAARLADGTPTRWIGTITDVTGRKRAEEALRDSELFLDSVIEHSPHAMWISDSHGTLIRLNQACRDLLRITDDEVVGKYNVLEDNIVAEQGQLDLVRRVFEHGESARFTIDYRSARLDLALDRRVSVVLDVTMSAVRGADGRVAHAIVQHVDITDRVRAEEEVSRQKRIAEIFLAVPDDEMFHEVLKVVLEVMDSRYGVFGYLDEAGALLVPTMTRDVWDKCQVAEKTITFPRDTWGDSSWPRAIRERTPNYSNEVSTRTPEGHVRLRRHVSLPILLGGEVIGLFQVANKETDYTDEDVRRLGAIAEYVAPVLGARLRRERTHAALRQSEQKFRETIQALDEGYYSVTPAGVLLDHNPAFNRILGIDPARDLKGAHLPDFWLRPNDRQEYLRELAARGLIRNFHIGVKTAGGDTTAVLVNAHAVKDASDSVVRIDGTVTDYTDRQRAEEEIRTLNAELEARVVQRTERLAAANEELEAFAYSVSHDLRAPLRHIDGYAGLLLERFHAELNEQGRHYLDSVVDAVRQMGRLIDDLLQLSRTGRAEIHDSEVDTTRVVREALVALEPERAGRQVEWVVGDLPAVRGDEALLQLVWTNLLSNALKYTRPRAQARIEVGWREEPHEIVFFVRDDGVGFDMRYAHKLFGVFQRLHSATEFEGTGIGLATVRRIVARHGGRTWAEGVLGQGATFSFSLPRSGGDK